MFLQSPDMYVIDLANSKTMEYQNGGGLIFVCDKPGCVSYVMGGDIAHAARSN
jgi:hypothetical protein